MSNSVLKVRGPLGDALVTQGLVVANQANYVIPAGTRQKHYSDLAFDFAQTNGRSPMRGCSSGCSQNCGSRVYSRCC